MKKILVTGGAGFIGSNLMRRLLDDNHKVICIDNFSSGSFSNIKDLIEIENFRFIEHNIQLPVELTNLDKIDEIYNLACPASPPKYQLDPIDTIKTSIYGAINVLELARKHGSKVMQSSTSEVYGDPEVHPQVEHYRGNVNPIGIRACYDEGKRCAETIFFDYKRRYGIDIKVIRIFNTYGPYMDPNDGRVVSNFINQCLRNDDLTVYGDGSQTRSFQYIDDLVDAMIVFMGKGKNYSGPINLGNPYEFTVHYLAEKVIAMLGANSKIVYESLPMDDPKQRKPDISLAKDILDWAPNIELDVGLKRTIEYFKKLKGCY